VIARGTEKKQCVRYKKIGQLLSDGGIEQKGNKSDEASRYRGCPYHSPKHESKHQREGGGSPQGMHKSRYSEVE
jgi:ribosomal protein L19E